MPRRSAQEAALTRQRILDEAQALFAEQGFADTSANQIAKAAGVTDGALFHHFKDKKALFAEIVVNLHTELHKVIYRAARNAPDGLQGLRVGARESVRLTQQPHISRIVFIEGPVVLGIEQWRKIDQQLGLRLLEGGLLRLIGAEALPDSILKPMTVMALGTINELTYALIRQEPGVDAEKVLDSLERAIQLWIDTDVKAWRDV